MYRATPTVFHVHQWIMPATTCDYPVLAVAQDYSVLLSLGNYHLDFDWEIREEAHLWLAKDFVPTGQTVSCDLSMVRYHLMATFAGGVEFGIMRFDEQLRPTRLELALTAQQEAEQGAEYLIHALGNYQRFYREPERLVAVTAAERTMLDVCVSAFAKTAVQCGELLSQPLPPRYRAAD